MFGSEVGKNKKEKLTLTQATIEKLGYYVYLLIDPFSKKPFYVGKGKGGRIFAHIRGIEKESKRDDEKSAKIREILADGGMVEHKILRHALTKKEAFEIESATIDYIGVENLTNQVKGYHSDTKGMMTIEELKLLYEAEEAVFTEPTMLININVNYRKEMGYEELYEATRKHWSVSKKRAEKIPVACSVYKGIVREVFQIHRWIKSDSIENRYMFEGEQAPAHIREKYLHKSVKKSWNPRGNPIGYLP